MMGYLRKIDSQLIFLDEECDGANKNEQVVDCNNVQGLGETNTEPPTDLVVEAPAITEEDGDAVSSSDLVVEAPAIMEEDGDDVTPTDLAVEAPTDSAVEASMIMEEEEELVGCTSAFDENSKCVMAVCKSCHCDGINKGMGRERMCKCRVRGMKMSTKNLPENISADWNLGLIDQSVNDFKDLTFCLPVTCGKCNRFLSKEIESAVNYEMQVAETEKLKTNPKWIGRDWKTLRKVAQNSWPTDEYI